jgi:hypothetical protein
VCWWFRQVVSWWGWHPLQQGSVRACGRDHNSGVTCNTPRLQLQHAQPQACDDLLKASTACSVPHTVANPWWLRRDCHDIVWSFSATMVDWCSLLPACCLAVDVEGDWFSADVSWMVSGVPGATLAAPLECIRRMWLTAPQQRRDWGVCVGKVCGGVHR